MKLLFDLSEEQTRALGLDADESVWYCVPYDLTYNTKMKVAEERYTDGRQFFVVTEKRMILLDDNVVAAQYTLKDCDNIKCESQINSGIVTAVIDGTRHCILRFSMRHIIRISYVARGAQLLAKGSRERVESTEYELYCEKCGRALPGTSLCPRCSGRGVMLRKFLDICKNYKGKMCLITLFMVIASVIAILMPKVQQYFIDRVLAPKTGTGKDIALFLAVMLVLTVVLLAVNITKNWWCASLGALICMDLRKRLYAKIQTLSLAFVQRRKPGELMNRVGGDTSRIRDFMEEVYGSMVSNLITMTAALIYMFALSFRMTLYSLGLIVAVFFCIKMFWKHIHRIFHMQWEKDDKMRSGLQDIISGMRVVKAFGKEDAEAEKFRALSDDFAAVQKKNEVFWAVFYPMMTFILGIGSYVAIYFGGLDVLGGKMSLGQLVQFVTYTGYLYGPLGYMTHLPRSVMQMLTSMNRISDVLDENPEIADKEKAVEHEIEGAIEFQDVSFGYHSYEPVLEHINLSVKPGEMIGLVGASGTGKSTLINLIMRLYDVDQGSISVDGIDLRDIQVESLHAQLGVVLQETFLFSGSILNNLRFAKPDATMEEIIRAAKAANAHDFICKTPDGYNTYVGEHGYNLSGGERQRIAIARAILNNPRLLILDEATSALDTESEYLIQQALNRLVKGRTTFAIAHRLSTLRNADRLVVIDGHNIAEVGTHDELLQKQGIYYNLVKAQMEMAGMQEKRA